MWNIIDAVDSDSIKKIILMLIQIHPGYETLEVDDLQMLASKKDRFQLHFYQDKDNEACLISFVTPRGDLRIIAGNASKFIDSQVVLDIMNKRILETLNLFGLKYAWAVRDANHGGFYESFYTDMISIAKSSGFSDAKTTNKTAAKLMEFFAP